MIRRPIWFLALAMVWAVAPSFAHAQDGGSIVGEVVDQATLEPIVGATITVVSHELSDLTNEDGHFSLRGVPAGSISVRVERLGYIAVVLDDAPHHAGDELRVVADRSEVEVESGGSYTEIIPDESDSARNALELLTTRVPSLTVRTDAIGGATRSEIRIRGNGSVSQSNMPSIYIDGARADIVYLEDLSATEVRRIRVLRGPSAASVYPDAANGVILVETWRTRN